MTVVQRAKRGGDATPRSDSRGKYSTPAVEKAFAVLEMISNRGDGARMVDVVDELGLPKSSAFVILSALEDLGYLSRDGDGRYRLTLRMFELGTRAMRSIDVTQVALPVLERLRDRTELTVHLAERDHNSVVYLMKIEGPGFVRFDTYVGKRAALHLTAVGKALAAHLDAEQLRAVTADLDFSRGTANSIKSARALKTQLNRVRRNGYATEDEEEVRGVRCVAAPVRNHHGDVVVAVGVIGLAGDLVGSRLEKVGAAVVAAADEITELLGGSAGIEQ